MQPREGVSLSSGHRTAEQVLNLYGIKKITENNCNVLDFIASCCIVRGENYVYSEYKWETSGIL